MQAQQQGEEQNNVWQSQHENVSSLVHQIRADGEPGWSRLLVLSVRQYTRIYRYDKSTNH